MNHSSSGEWFSTWVMVFGGGTGINAVGPKIFVWPLICCFLAAAYVYFCCPETTGKTLEELDWLFAKPEVRARIEAEGMGRRNSWASRRASTQGYMREKEPTAEYNEGKSHSSGDVSKV